MKVLIVDNIDSFTFNLYQHVGEILNCKNPGSTVRVIRNNEKTLEEIEAEAYDRIIISPGPGHPGEAAYFGICQDILLKTAQTTPTLGICLGMQGMAHYFGGRVIKAKVPMHGKTSVIVHQQVGVFQSIPTQFQSMRYHSLVVDPQTLPSCFQITARVFNQSGQGEIMGIKHKEYPLEGVQFHPESFATEYGVQIVSNFLEKEYATSYCKR